MSSQISTELFNLFQNEKIVELFSNSDGGQGLLYKKIEDTLSFSEMINMMEMVFETDAYIRFVSNHKQYPNILSFINHLKFKINELIFEYIEIGNSIYILKLINENKEFICENFPRKTKKESYNDFYYKYMDYYSGVKKLSYSNSKGFFDDPLFYLK